MLFELPFLYFALGSNSLVHSQINATGKIIKKVTVDDVDPWGPCRNILQKGDIINSIAETAVTDLTINKFVRLVSGEEGTTVKIGFARGEWCAGSACMHY